MKKLTFLTIFALLALSVLAACGGSSTTTSAPTSVTMGAVQFNSTSVTITKGSTINFTTDQGGTAHNLVNGTNGKNRIESGAPDFGTGGQTVGPGKTWTSPPWNTAGTFHVTCTYHPTTMTMTVIVTG